MIDIIFHDETGIVSCCPEETGGFENACGSGEIHYYRLFDGVGIMLLRLEMETYTEIRTQVGVSEINFCINGRFETNFSTRDRVLLKPGDMAISCYDGFHGTRSESRFPLGYYEGVCLEIDSEAADVWISKNAPAFCVDFSAIVHSAHTRLPQAPITKQPPEKIRWLWLCQVDSLISASK